MIRRMRLTAVCAAVALLTACGSDASEPSGATIPAGAAAPGGGTIVWQGIGNGLDQTFLTVPLDYADPTGATIQLALVRHRATEPDDRIGTLLVNPGGPGFGGTYLAAAAEQLFGDDLLERFDIVGWDPRGTGESVPAIDCIDDYDSVFSATDITPDDDAERQQLVTVAQGFAEACTTKNADLLQHVATNDAARDMDAIRQALGEQTISYFGFSYGSELGAVWSTLFPDTVRAAVLDGATDPTVDPLEASVQQAVGFEQALDRFLADCSARSKCSFHNDGNAEPAFDALMASIDEQPLPTVKGRTTLTRGAALIGVADAMYDEAYWSTLADALHDAQGGDGAGLLALYDDYNQRDPKTGTYGNELEAFQVISCMDEPTRTSVAEDDANAATYRDAAPRTSPGTTGSYFCTFFPPSDDPRVPITAAATVPIVVIGTTGDPATPLEGTRRMADALADGRLIVVTADRHTGYGVNDCSKQNVDAYLIDPVGHAPPDDTACN